MQEQESKLLIVIMGLTILLVELIIFGGFGIAVPISVGIFYGVSFWYSKSLGIERDLSSEKLLIPIVLVNLCFVLFDNELLKFFNIMFLYSLIVLQTSHQYKINFFEPLSKKWLLEIGSIGIVQPLQNLDAPIKVINRQMNKGAKEIFIKLGKVLLGFAIALPILLLTTIFLMSADVAFSSVIETVFESIDIDLERIVGRIIAAIGVFFLLYGFFYGMNHRKDFIGPKKQEGTRQILDFTIVITVAILLCMVYGLYVASQFAYFISAFQGVLPADYTFAHYARKGFFELLPVIMINLGMIIVLEEYTQGRESCKKNYWRKGIVLFLSIFTVFLATSALAKMFLYMASYGLTLKRVYVSWFLILVLIILILVIVRLFKESLPLIKYSVIVFVVMYIGLNYSNVDYLIANYNCNVYLNEYGGGMSELDQLSSSAVEPMIKLAKKGDLEIKGIIDGLLESKEYEIEEEKWQEWNIASYRAKKQIQNYKNNK